MRSSLKSVYFIIICFVNFFSYSIPSYHFISSHLLPSPPSHLSSPLLPLSSPQYFEVPGVKAVCEALCENRFLQVLDLGLNKVRKVQTCADSGGGMAVLTYVLCIYTVVHMCVWGGGGACGGVWGACVGGST